MNKRNTPVLRLGLLLSMALTGCSDGGDREELGVHRGKVVYGSDDRQEPYVYADQAFATKILNATVALIYDSKIDDSDTDDIQLLSGTLGEALPLCAGERFFSQQDVAFCSGTLIAPDLVLTAGHCVENASDCNKLSIVFNYAMQDADTLTTIVANDVFQCQKLEAQIHTSTVDYAVMRLDRPAEGRIPADIRSGRMALAVGTELVVAGCPSGLPIKIADNAVVRDGRAGTVDYFVSNLDTFHGNSGSGVYMAKTGELVGILVRGEQDYVLNSDCYVVKQCSNSGCRGEDSVYVHQAIDALCDAIEYDLLCLCGDGTCDTDENSVNCWVDCGTACGDGVCNGGETLGTCFGDCSVCGNEECDSEEALSGSCCTDCGCSGGLLCIDNTCQLDPALGDDCTSPTVIPDEGTETFIGNTESATDIYTGSCGLSGSPERVFSFTLDMPSYIDARVTGFDTVLYLRTTCDDAESELECDDDSVPPGDDGSRISRSLDPGEYFLFVDGSGASQGLFSLETALAAFICGDGDCNLGESPSNCPQDCGYCGNAVCDTDPLETSVSCCTDCGCDVPLVCEDNECVPDMEPGNGCANPVDIEVAATQTVLGNWQLSGDYFSGSCGGNGGYDRVYSFEIDAVYDVTAETSGDDAVLYLRTVCEDSGAEISCNDGANPSLDGSARIELIDLDPGIYYLIVDGKTSSSLSYSLTLSFVDKSPCPDADGDGYCDSEESCYEDPRKQEPGFCGCGIADVDGDGDLTPDCVDECPEDSDKDEAGACGCGVPETDGDSDGTPDCVDGCPTDPDRIEPGVLGCQQIKIADLCPLDPDKTTPGRCGCGVEDADGDGDGLPDCLDSCPEDPQKTEPGACGCGLPEADSDGDGKADCLASSSSVTDGGTGDGPLSDGAPQAGDGGVERKTSKGDKGCGCVTVAATGEHLSLVAATIKMIVRLAI